MITVVVLASLLAQGSNLTVPLPNPYGPAARSNPRPTVPVRQPVGRPFRGRGIGGGWWIGNSVSQTETPAPAEPPKQDPLRELVISPVYEKPKFTPKMIEIP